MERFNIVLLSFTFFLIVFAWDAEGARTIKSSDAVDHPQNFIPGVPIPGFTGSFPSPGSTGLFPSPGFTGSFPSPGFTGSLPSPSIGIFCLLPGVCTPAMPTNPGGPIGGGSGSP
ncbi:hypothetical protein LguiB_006429 [Lonicera macranthoides]